MGTSPLLAAFFLAQASSLCFFSLLCLWSVLGGQLKQLSSCLSVQGLGELLNCRRYFQQLIENSPLLLQPDIAGPFDKAGEVPLGLDVLSNAKIIGPLLEQGLTTFLASCFFTMARAGASFFPLAFFPFGILKGWRTAGSFLKSQLFTLGGQSTAALASASVLPVNIQD